MIWLCIIIRTYVCDNGKDLKAHFHVWVNFWQLKALLKWWKKLLFHLKSSFHSKMFKFLPRPFWSCSKTMYLFGHGFMRNLRSISKFMASSTGKQIITVLILPKISRSKCNQTMKFGMLVEYNMRNIFLENSYRIYSREYSPKPFFKY